MEDSQLADLIRQIRLVVFDFDGVFTDNSVYVSQDGTETVRCWRGDGLGLRILDDFGVATLVLSTEANPVVAARCSKLKIRCLQGCADKVVLLHQVALQSGVSLGATAYLGNDINDAGCLHQVGLPMVVHDAHPEVISLAKYRTNNRGGCGAVREVCDLFKAALSRQI